MPEQIFERKIMKFFLPVDISSIGGEGVVSREVIPLYINPQNVQIQEGKLISDTLTKGGYIIQYWGEKLIGLQVSGTTGSGGIEAINILRDVYRHEQIIFRDLMIKKAQDFEEQAVNTLSDVSSANASSGLLLAADALTGGAVSNLIDGVSNTIDYIVDAASGSGEESAAESFEMPPTLASFATSIDIFFHGETYRGYFTSFSLTEQANSPGIFDYSFQFNATRRTGLRTNFMPWHRNPRGADGRPRKSLGPMADEIADLDNLTFPVSDQYKRTARIVNGNIEKRPESDFVNNPTLADAEADVNQQPMNRNASLGKSS
jgi:hypothetical protein